MIVFVFVCPALLFSDFLSSSSEWEVGFFLSRGTGHHGSTGGTRLQILLKFVLVKQFHSQIEHVISSLLNLPFFQLRLSGCLLFISGLFTQNVGRHKGLYQVPCTL